MSRKSAYSPKCLVCNSKAFRKFYFIYFHQNCFRILACFRYTNCFSAIFKALESIPLYKIYKTYGYPNDVLVRLNISFCSIKEVKVKPIYQVGENSKMKIGKIIIPILWLLIKGFIKRIWIKYLFKDFHPLFILYHFSFLLLGLAIPYAIQIIENFSTK